MPGFEEPVEARIRIRLPNNYMQRLISMERQYEISAQNISFCILLSRSAASTFAFQHQQWALSVPVSSGSVTLTEPLLVLVDTENSSVLAQGANLIGEVIVRKGEPNLLSEELPDEVHSSCV